MKIHIKDRDVELKSTIRSLIYFENIMGKSFDLQNVKTLDLTVLELCTLLACDKGLHLDFQELVDAIDEDNSILTDFTDWFIEEMKKQAMLSKDLEGDDEDSKKA